MHIQEKNIRETETTGNNLSGLGNQSTTRPLVIILTVVLSILATSVISIAAYFIYRCRRDNHASPTSIINIDTKTNQPVESTSQPTQDNLGSLYDLLTAFAQNKKTKQ